MEQYFNKQISVISEKSEEYKEEKELLPKETEFCEINQLYDECLTYLKQESVESEREHDPDYESIEEKYDVDLLSIDDNHEDKEEINNRIDNTMVYKIENELISNESINTVTSEPRSERLRKLSQQLPKIIITQSNTSLNIKRHEDFNIRNVYGFKRNDIKKVEHKSLPKISDNHNYDIKQSYIKSDRLIHSDMELGSNKRNKTDVQKLIGNGKKKPHKSEKK